MTDDNNLFDEDDALDYILYEEVNKETSDGGKGCFGDDYSVNPSSCRVWISFFNNSSIMVIFFGETGR